MEKNSKIVLITLGSLTIISALLITIILTKDKWSSKKESIKRNQSDSNKKSVTDISQNKIDVFSGKKPLTFGEFVKKEKENEAYDITIEDYQEYLRKGDAYEF